MIFKIIGAVVFVVSSGLYGIYSGKKIEASLEQAKDLRSGIKALKQEIYFNGLPIGKAFGSASEVMTTEMRDVFKKCGTDISGNSGISLQECFISYMNEPMILLEGECKRIISRWTSNAGSGDRKTELDSLEYALSQLDQFIANAEERCAKQVRIYKSCGFLIGAFVVAVLI